MGEGVGGDISEKQANCCAHYILCHPNLKILCPCLHKLESLDRQLRQHIGVAAK